MAAVAHRHPSQQAVFDRCLPALSRREQGHVQLGRDTAQAIEEGIARLSAATDCVTLERTANALGHRLLRGHTEREKAYDQHTGHGATQGVRLK